MQGLKTGKKAWRTTARFVHCESSAKREYENIVELINGSIQAGYFEANTVIEHLEILDRFVKRGYDVKLYKEEGKANVARISWDNPSGQYIIIVNEVTNKQ